MYMNDGIKTKINLRSKSVFITGVAGFIGSNLAKRLLSTVEDVKVVGLDNMNHYYENYVGGDNCHCLWAHDRDLSLYIACPDPVRNDEQP